MHFLIIGNINSSHIRSFNRSLFDYASQRSITIKLDAIHIRATIDKGLCKDYEQLFVANPTLSPLIQRIPKIRAIFKLLKQRLIYHQINRQIKKYDCILLHGFWKKSLDVLSVLDISKSHIVGAFWGSDFYRRDKQYDNLFQSVLQRCDSTIISTKEMEQEISRQFKIESKKIHNVLFGVQALQRLFDLQSVSRVESKRILRKNGSFIITCGYCARPEMRHREIIVELEKIRKYLPQNYMLIFPMTYSGSKAYIEEVRHLLEQSQLRYMILDSYLSDEEIAYLRKATDIFIQIQTTDANSGSMQEHLVAQNLVITGSWLPYQEYFEKDIYFETIDTPGQLSQKIVETLSNWNEVTNKVHTHNLPDKFRSSLWSEAIKDWFQVLTDKKTTNDRED